MDTRDGSPPHAWGIQFPVGAGCVVARFTPTRVGNTRGRPQSTAVAEVHPPTRGEYSSVVFGCDSCVGSPPHAWGILKFVLRVLAHGRFTPTRVGNTMRAASDTLPVPVHPHTRGEYALSRVSMAALRGSPPHAWGIQATRDDLIDLLRFTPTRVGNTAATPSASAPATVHPHTRGEYD